MRVLLKISVWLVFCLLYGCTDSSIDVDNAKAVSELSWLFDANPEEDFYNAVDEKDYRFIGVNSYSLFVPRVSIRCLDIDENVKTLRGTADAVNSYEHAKLMAIAKVYADYYNLRMRAYLEDAGLFSCNDGKISQKGQALHLTSSVF